MMKTLRVSPPARAGAPSASIAATANRQPATRLGSVFTETSLRDGCPSAIGRSVRIRAGRKSGLARTKGRPRQPVGVLGTVARLVQQRLDLQELLEPVLTGLASFSGLLVSPERSVGVEAAGVDLHLAGADAARDLLRVLDVAREHRAHQAVDGVVGDADGVLFVAVRDDRQDGTEDLLLRDRHVVAHAGEDGRLHEEALGEALGLLGSAGDELGAFLDALLDVAAHALLLLRRDQGAEPRRSLER